LHGLSDGFFCMAFNMVLFLRSRLLPETGR